MLGGSVAKLRLQITMSLDGYVAGPRQTAENPLGDGGLALHEWAFATKSFRASHGGEGGETGLDDDRLAAATTGIGATIMGRNMFGPVRGDWGDEQWRGWWGDDPPFHTPVFVLTHHPREPLAMDGGTTFHFVTDGIEAALERATAAASGRDVALGGGAMTAQQYLRASLVDVMEIHVVPLLMGEGERLFADLDGGPVGYACTSLLSSPAAAHFTFERAKPG
jgi:dihydrofolate reductase